MARSSIVTGCAAAIRLPAGRVGWVAVLGVVAFLPPSLHGQASPRPAQPTTARQAVSPPRPIADREARALAAMLDRASTLTPGTYVASGNAFEPYAERVPMVVQADALRGPDESITLAVALGAQATQPVSTRLRVMAAGTRTSATVADVSGASSAGVVRAVHTLAVVPGEYALVAAMAHTRSDGRTVVSLAKSPLVVPDLWHGALSLSPLVIGDAVGAVPQASANSPFAFGPTALRPSAGDWFSQNGDLHVAFRVSNWTATSEGEPDLLVEYRFYERVPTSPHFFNKVKPQRLNGDVLGTRFDRNAGVVHGGMTIPLAAFPVGEFELRVTVTDNRTKQSATQVAAFAVIR